jgi:hypothetical protein
MPNLANQYSTENPGNSTTGVVGGGIAFGFVANLIRILNDSGSAVYINIGTSSRTTAGHRTCASEALEICGAPTACLGWGTTSTTTSTAGAPIRISAWGL